MQLWEGIESMRGEPCVIATGDAIYTFATPATDFGLQRLFRVDPDSGKAVWSTPPFEEPAGNACPATDGDLVYYPNGKSLVAAKAVNGETQWTASLPAAAGKPVVSGGRVYVVASNTLFALNADNGSILWNVPVGATSRPPLVVSGVAINVSHGSGASLQAFDGETGAALWSQEGKASDAIAYDGALIYSLGKTVRSRGAISGAVEWSYETPPLTEASKLVADEGIVYALTPSTDVRFQVDHLVALNEKTGAVQYAREYAPVESCCATTGGYPPFVKFGANLYNHYRYFDAATGASPGAPTERTQSIFFDGNGCAVEQDSAFAHVGGTIYAWKNLCSRIVLVARETLPSEGPGKIDLIEPASEAVTGPRPNFSWEVGSPADTTRYQIYVDESLSREVLASDATRYSVTLKQDLTEGAHSWAIVALATGGGETRSGTHIFTVDASPPAPFELLEPADGSTTSSRPEFAWTAAEDQGPAGIDRYEISIDGKVRAKLPAGSQSFVPDFDLGEGGHSWTVAAFDKAGNQRQAEARKFFVDGTGPGTVELIAPLQGQATGTRPEFRWWAPLDEGSGVDRYELFLDESLLAEIPANEEEKFVSFVPEGDLPQGPHSWSVRAVDGAGNSQTSPTATFVVDAAPPFPFALLAPADESAVGSRPEFDWEASGDAGSGISGYELILDGESILVEDDRYLPEFDLPDGAHTWSVVAVDGGGNRTESESRDFSVDTAPPAPFVQLVPADGAVTGARPSFEWEPATDVGAAGLDHYELHLDGQFAAQVPAGSESFVPSQDLEPGEHTWSVVAVDALGNSSTTKARRLIVASPPNAILSAESEFALTGVPFGFDASASIPPLGGEIIGYRWDLDGDGSFELDTGTTPTASHVYSNVGDLTVSVEVSSNFGTQATASQRVSVRPAPPAGPLGVTINNGAQFTNSPEVTVSLVWPVFASTALLANDGGFRTAGEFPLGAQIPWTLESSGKERLPKTVYVRFAGGTAGRETYQDDIILDEQKPKVGKASIADGTKLSLTARDSTSGVVAVQIASGKLAVGPWRPFQRLIRWSHPHRQVRVRVRDRAGNVSRWRLAAFTRSAP
ncbi:MAG TPA: PQQ-binding-like beta-propeller repeat protein [Solirubrobacterales bacterium]